MPLPALAASLPRRTRQHDGRITTDTPDELWANDRTEAWTRLDGRCAGFPVVDHCIGQARVDTASTMDRWAAALFNVHWLIERHGYRSPLKPAPPSLALRPAVA